MQRSKKRTRSQIGQGILSQVNKYIPVASFFSTFLTVQDINSQATATNKIETFVNQVTGKLTGVNFFNTVPQYTPNINIAAVNNPVTRAGAVLAIAGIIGQKFKLPYTGRLKSVGVKIAIPSAIGAMIGGQPVGTAAVATQTVSSGSQTQI